MYQMTNGHQGQKKLTSLKKKVEKVEKNFRQFHLTLLGCGGEGRGGGEAWGEDTFSAVEFTVLLSGRNFVSHRYSFVKNKVLPLAIKRLHGMPKCESRVRVDRCIEAVRGRSGRGVSAASGS